MLASDVWPYRTFPLCLGLLWTILKSTVDWENEVCWLGPCRPTFVSVLCKRQKRICYIEKYFLLFVFINSIWYTLEVGVKVYRVGLWLIFEPTENFKNIYVISKFLRDGMRIGVGLWKNLFDVNYSLCE